MNPEPPISNLEPLLKAGQRAAYKSGTVRSKRGSLGRQRRVQRVLYLLSDFVVSYCVSLLFVLLRREWADEPLQLEAQQFLNATVITTGWLIIYAIAGLYSKPLRRSRVQEVIQVFKYTLIGVIFLFFAIIIDDQVKTSDSQRITTTIFFFMQFLSISIARFLLTTFTQVRIRKRKIGFPTVIVGCGPTAWDIFQELEEMNRSLGYSFKGFISMPESAQNLFSGKLKHFGKLDSLYQALVSRRIEEVIIALEKDESAQIGK